MLYSVFGLYYYLKIANAMFMRQPEKGEEKLPVSLAMRVALGLTGLATLYIGIMPNRFHRDRELGIGDCAAVKSRQPDALDECVLEAGAAVSGPPNWLSPHATTCRIISSERLAQSPSTPPEDSNTIRN